MKHYILTSIIFLLSFANIFAQSSDQNYIRTRTFTSENGNNGTFLDQVQYFDGLGRPNETVLRKITTEQKDLVSYLKYDNFGREKWQYLPTKIDQDNGNFVTFSTFENEANDFYSDSRPYVENILESSPLNRILGQKGAGAAWEQHPTSINYASNTASEVPYFKVSGNNLVRSGNYAANTLYKTVSSDEDGKTATEFKDKLGNVVMTMQGIDNKTCYVFDDFGNQRYVLPPLAVDALGNGTYADDNSTLKLYAYVYKYDNRGRQIYKRLPGCEPIYMVYDKADRLVMSQDGNQRTNNQNKWTVTTYDVFGRVLYTAQIVDNRTHSDLQAHYSARVVNEAFDISKPFGYTQTFFPNTGNLLIVNYYDNYNFLSLFDDNTQMELHYVENSDYGEAYIERRRVGCSFQYLPTSKTLLTGTRSYILDNSGNYLVSAFYYDKKNQIVQSRSTNHLQGFDIVYNKYSFTGNIEKSLKEHSTANGTIPELYNYTYDHAGRLLSTTYTLKNGYPIVLAENNYDDLSRIIAKKRHNTSDAENFTYNIKNWTTKIESGNFVENLYYNTGNNPNYNGNISAMEWTSNGNNNKYLFEYNELNRLENGVLTNGSYGESFVYDKHGNIETLQRYSQETIMDNLTLHYNGNQLESVDETVPNSLDYYKKEYNKNSEEEMKYDVNGNLILDLDRKILSIKYNVLNLPSEITFEDGHSIANVYSADGRKLKSMYRTKIYGVLDPRENTLQKIVGSGGIGNNNPPKPIYYYEGAGTYYLGNIEYEFEIDRSNELQPTLKRISNAEGYVADNKYYYYRRDHLGNNREVWNATANATVQITNYYPSGLPWKTTQAQNPDLQPYKYNGKEFVEDYGYDVFDYGARTMRPAFPRFEQIDPLCERHYNLSPYVLAGNNFVNYIDAYGLDSTWYNSNGDIIYTCGDDPNVNVNFVTKTTQTTDEMYGNAPLKERGKSNPITPEASTTTEEKISSGNIIGSHMKNVVKIQNSDRMEAMLNSIKDDGTGGTSAANNKEYAGTFGGKKEVYNTKESSVGNPQKGIDPVTQGTNDYHSHPSGKVKFVKDGVNMVGSYVQPPSKTDIDGANRTLYVPAMGNGIIYIFNRTGVIATIPISTFK